MESGADICESKFIAEDKAVFYNPNTLYFAELGKGVLHTYPLDGNALVLLKGEGAYIVVHSDNEQALIKYISYDEIFEFGE